MSSADTFTIVATWADYYVGDDAHGDTDGSCGATNNAGSTVVTNGDYSNITCAAPVVDFTVGASATGNYVNTA